MKLNEKRIAEWLAKIDGAEDALKGGGVFTRGPRRQRSEAVIREDLRRLAYTQADFEQVIKLAWALPDGFWVQVVKRLIATVIVGPQ